jgi:hypothetical protein
MFPVALNIVSFAQSWTLISLISGSKGKHFYNV